MKQLNNQTAINLSVEQHTAIIQAAAIIEKAFQCRIFAAFLVPDKEHGQYDRLFSINFTVDMFNFKEDKWK